jgi:hypothetical protein
MIQKSQFWVCTENNKFQKVQDVSTPMFTETLLTTAKKHKQIKCHWHECIGRDSSQLLWEPLTNPSGCSTGMVPGAASHWKCQRSRHRTAWAPDDSQSANCARSAKTFWFGASTWGTQKKKHYLKQTNKKQTKQNQVILLCLVVICTNRKIIRILSKSFYPALGGKSVSLKCTGATNSW